jgi:hypothetical protein
MLGDKGTVGKGDENVSAKVLDGREGEVKLSLYMTCRSRTSRGITALILKWALDGWQVVSLRLQQL